MKRYRSDHYKTAIVREGPPNHYQVVETGGWLKRQEYSFKALGILAEAMSEKYGERADGQKWITVASI